MKISDITKAIGVDGYENIKEDKRYVLLTEEYFEGLLCLIRSYEEPGDNIAKPFKGEFGITCKDDDVRDNDDVRDFVIDN